MVRQWQQLYYNNNLQAVKLFHPDFVKLAESFGLAGLRVDSRDQVEPTIEKAMRHPGPVLIDFQVDEAENLYPMMGPGASLAETVDQPPIEDALPLEPGRVR
jgi:acetolactate synthase-1/2/3 large subunit